MRLFGFEMTWAAAAFGAVLPEGTALPHGIARLDPARYLAETVAAAPLVQATGVRLALWLVAFAPLWLLRKPKTIAGLAPAERELVLERLLSNPVYAVRQLTLTFKALASMLYAQSIEARRAMTTPSVRPPPLSSSAPAAAHDKKLVEIRLPRSLTLKPAVYPHEQPAE